MTRKQLTEEQIQRMIDSDPKAPEVTDKQLAQARPFSEVFPALADAMRRNFGGHPKADNPKVAVSLRLHQEVVARFKATGPGWQTRMNDALQDAAGLCELALQLRRLVRRIFGMCTSRRFQNTLKHFQMIFRHLVGPVRSS